MSVYLDASVLVPLVVRDTLGERADAFLRSGSPVLVISDFAAAEVASAIARRVRMRELIPEEANRAFSMFDTWVLQESQSAHIIPVDVAAAASLLRRLDLPLRTPDALHLAIARRLGASLATFDHKLAQSARAIGLDVANA